ncbi:EAL domain-containing protein [Sulfurimonas sp.]|uniref:EAL domain-containing protein n=1 Tax=Sulfurimonas sp. TaxID=2022749 RepID=UPI0026030837|nr:EAL domain-containing protein [Sulfurimonas sp.]
MESSPLKIRNFTLKSSTDVPSVVRKIKELEHDQLLIHILSYFHNTVLVQTLYKELLHLYPNSKIVLLKHEDKVTTSVNIFSLDLDDIENISDEVLKELYLDNSDKNHCIEDYRTQLFKRYFTDHLTNLPNLYQLRKDLEHLENPGLILLKVDNFQTINNFYGFIVGDYVLESVGKFLKKTLPDNKVYRLSGAEFAITTEINLGFYELKKYIEEIYHKISKIRVYYQKTKIYIDFTFGSSSKKDSSNIFSKVSMALMYAKQRGVPYWIYEDRMHFEDDYSRNLTMSHTVKEAVDNSKVLPYYQAILDNKTGKVVKYECLARLVDSNEKIIAPAIFIPVAKKIKVYNKVTQCIINKSFDFFENSNYEFSINLSIEDIMSSEMFHFIIEKLKNSEASSRVTFEILESEAIQDFKRVDRFISEVRRYGAQIAIDDFGSGYSNFLYLTKVEADYIKIDGSLIKNIDVNPSALIVVETIVDFAKKLGIKTIAEYVHSSVVMDKVVDLGIDYSQGFYIDEPSLHIE